MRALLVALAGMGRAASRGVRGPGRAVFARLGETQVRASPASAVVSVGGCGEGWVMTMHRLTLRKGSDFELMWRGWRRKGRGKAPKRFRLIRAGSFRVAVCACGWESSHRKGVTAVEDAVHDWEKHRDG